MKAQEIRQRYIDFFVKKYRHQQISSASLIPENDSSVLFTTAGMQPLIPFLIGGTHQAGHRLVDYQKCVRTDDIDKIGDDSHLTFFEMLGNWSLGDYFKELTIKMSYELLTLPEDAGGFGMDDNRLRVTCFEGDSNVPQDLEAASYWQKHGFVSKDKANLDQRKLIYFYEKEKNWWNAGNTGPCGPDTEIFYDNYPQLNPYEHIPGATMDLINKYPLKDGSGRCHPNCECGHYIEIWNNVFMQFNKKADGTMEELKQKNVDTGMGFERIVAILEGKNSPYQTDLFDKIFDYIEKLAKLPRSDDEDVLAERRKSMRIIADHLRAAVFILGDNMAVSPSNTDQGYILRRLIRRAIRHGKKLGINKEFAAELAKLYIQEYGDFYIELQKNKKRILTELVQEENKFQNTLENGLREMKKIFDVLGNDQNSKFAVIDRKESNNLAEKAFLLYESYGFPMEMVEEELLRAGISYDSESFRKKFEEKFKAHQSLSKVGAKQKFAGGLADHSEESCKLHTATHLLHKALQMVLGDEVQQRGSNITPERLRFDFNYGQKMTPEQISEVEKIVNEQIARKLPISFKVMTVDEAKKEGATGLFENKYGNQIKVYTMGDFSMEICGGPHAENTSDLGAFKIIKEEASSAGVRRIKAIIGNH